MQATAEFIVLHSLDALLASRDQSTVLISDQYSTVKKMADAGPTHTIYYHGKQVETLTSRNSISLCLFVAFGE